MLIYGNHILVCFVEIIAGNQCSYSRIIQALRKQISIFFRMEATVINWENAIHFTLAQSLQLLLHRIKGNGLELYAAIDKAVLSLLNKGSQGTLQLARVRILTTIAQNSLLVA